MDFVYKFPVVKGMQAGNEYYIAMVPLKMLSKLFVNNDEYVSPEYRAQRKLNESRIPVICKYILDNKNSYVFSALAASIDGNYVFIPEKNNSACGILEIDMDSKILINDGQHRKTAIIEALKESPELGEETISIVFYGDYGLQRSQQIFTDLNKNAVKTSNSISELYDSRDEFAVLNRSVIKEIEFIDMYTDKEKDILGKYSSNLFTLNVFYIANKAIIGKKPDSKSYDFLINYWRLVTDNMVQWKDLQDRNITKKDLRESYISTRSVVIQALGKVGNYFYTHKDVSMEDYIPKIKNINWNRNSKEWYMRAINTNGRIITNQKAVSLISNYIKVSIGIELSSDEKYEEDNLRKQTVKE